MEVFMANITKTEQEIIIEPRIQQELAGEALC